jgi:hypothetical protein
MKKKRKVRHYRLILACLALSALSWFAVKISKNYTQTYHFEVEFVNLPKGKAVSYQSDTVIVIEINSKGMFLLSLGLKKKHISVDYQFVTTPTQRKSFYTTIQTKKLKDFLVEKMNFPKNTAVIDPKKITLELKKEND